MPSAGKNGATIEGFAEEAEIEVPDRDPDAVPAADLAADRPEPAEPPAPAAHRHPLSLVHDARRFHFTNDEIAATPTAELRDAVDYARREAALDARHRDALAAARPQSDPPAPEADELAELEADGFEPKLVEKLRAINDRAKRAEEQNKQLADRLVRTDATQKAAVLDDAFAALDAEYDGVFGQETGEELFNAGGGEKLEARKAVLRVAGIDLNKPLSAKAVAAKLRSAIDLMGRLTAKKPAKAESADKPDPYADEPPAGELEERKKQFRAGGVAKPADRVAPPPRKSADERDVRRRAMKAIADRQKRGGVGLEFEGNEEDDFQD
jgi:hypothetical protein